MGPLYDDLESGTTLGHSQACARMHLTRTRSTLDPSQTCVVRSNTTEIKQIIEFI